MATFLVTVFPWFDKLLIMCGLYFFLGLWLYQSVEDSASQEEETTYIDSMDVHPTEPW
jgi:hypothetical protein